MASGIGKGRNGFESASLREFNVDVTDAADRIRRRILFGRTFTPFRSVLIKLLIILAFEYLEFIKIRGLQKKYYKLIDNIRSMYSQ